jgi:hypothetical protein
MPVLQTSQAVAATAAERLQFFALHCLLPSLYMLGPSSPSCNASQLSSTSCQQQTLLLLLLPPPPHPEPTDHAIMLSLKRREMHRESGKSVSAAVAVAAAEEASARAVA